MNCYRHTTTNLSNLVDQYASSRLARSTITNNVFLLATMLTAGHVLFAHNMHTYLVKVACILYGNCSSSRLMQVQWGVAMLSSLQKRY
jgi:hypothetical protein